ncbi:uncharacterized protein LOC124155195 [Ischnura elegans]|uniref:uncharacterized protein LOC124155195 n=1 Tax=Ischnura elegans TaxID=197161 RepID=UPI001ED8BF9C|nr:uncharacterized protein LOC124155195 [Ischnura elegans]
MAPRVKKQRAGKPKDSLASTEGEPEIAEGGTEKITEDTESHEEVPKTEDGNGAEEDPPLKKGRGGRNVKKVPGKGKGASSPGDEDKSDDGDEKLPADVGTKDISSKVSGDHGDEEAPPAKKGRGRAKKAAIMEDCEVESKEDSDVAPAGAKKGRPRRKKADDDEPEVCSHE